MLPFDLACGSPFIGLEWLLVGDEGSMKLAFGTHTLLPHGRDEGISDPQTWKVSYETLYTVCLIHDFGQALHEISDTSIPCT